MVKPLRIIEFLYLRDSKLILDGLVLWTNNVKGVCWTLALEVSSQRPPCAVGKGP